MSTMLQGLSISLASIFITFTFFGLLVLMMVLLREIFKVPPKEIEPEIEEVNRLDQRLHDQDIDRMKAAGIAVLVASRKSEVQPDYGLGEVLESPPGRWWGDARRGGQYE